jgi:dihydrofolate reductase
MGKRTWESLPKRPLPGRKNIVLTDVQGEQIEGCITSYSIDDALAKGAGGEEIFIIGGGSVYRQFMPVADRLYITQIHKKTEADTFFPEINPQEWKEIEREEHESTSPYIPSYSYIIYERKKGER